MDKKNAVTILVFVLLCNALPALLNRVSGEPQEPKYGGTLVVAGNSDPIHLNPALLSSSVIDMAVGKGVYASLLRYDIEMNPKPFLAESWNISPDGKTWTFYLVQNCTWHDGEKFTSADVKFTIEEVLVHYHPTGGLLYGDLEEIETPDDYTVILKFSEPNGILINFLGTFYTPMLPKHLYEGTDIPNNPYNMEPIGCGPMKFKKWVKGQYVELERYPDYFMKEMPYLDRYIYRVIDDPSARVAAMKTGEVDWMISELCIPFERYQELLADPDLRDCAGALGAFGQNFIMLFNLRNEYLSDINVRRALAHAIDRKDFIEKAMFGLGAEGESPFSYLLPDHNPNIKGYEYNVTKANELLDEAGYERGPDGIRFTIRLLYDSGVSWKVSVGELFPEYLKKVGIGIVKEPRDHATEYNKAWDAYDFDLTFTGIFGGPDPIVGMGRLYLSQNIEPKGYAKNPFPYNNSRIDELFDEASKTVNFTKRKELLYEAQEILVEDLPTLTLCYSTGGPEVVSKEFGGIPISCFDGGGSNIDGVWWMLGYVNSPSTAAEAISAAENMISNLEDMNYDVTMAISKLEEAKTALEKGEYDPAKEKADLAPTFAIPSGVQPSPEPPYDLWTGILLALLVVHIIAVAGWLKKNL